MKCSRCGLESEIKEAFLVRKEWAGLVTRTYCPACWEKLYAREQVFSMAGLVAAVITLDVLFFNRGLGIVSIDILFLALTNILLVAAHELSHAAVGRLLGVRVYRVIIGYGKKLFSRRTFGISWELHEWIVGGGTLMASPPQKGSRVRLFGAILAGPALHGVLLIAAAAFQMFLLILQDGFGVDARAMLHWTGLFLNFNLILLIFNSLPMKAGIPSGQIGTDGWQLFHLIFMKPAEAEQLVQSYYLMETLEASLRNDAGTALRYIEEGLARFPEQPALRTSQGNVLIKQKRYAEAREIFLSLLSSEEAKKPFFKYLIFNNIAYTDALLRNPDLMPEADRYSAEALRQLGWEPMILGTRGAVLVEMGRLEEGIGLLKEALSKQKDAFGKAADAYHLAVGERRRGNAEESRRYLELARKYDPHHFLLDSAGP
jgi:tetratricopeptide (TPR) repeat protein